ncbi:hypothetical protein BO70DRAFT_329159 [Aspergillus heteromorphus CBS 117.55]|uniref:Transcription factor domain-containing protein n=1 Tax=Aspergillus heteromorphus CBS 117.55 TaxID=1448321 RepID=A0A317X095_9EURO|nr:uncharacterized protein BO70DRAFT_329159 [Aspergillus heteromorphus CBS 117.55]PWY91002.1 hypothetical protein BO70DRAFT_329159 [Aspergillus heteromorphus CBS 117.55]
MGAGRISKIALIYRICSYTSKFFPCPKYPTGTIHGMALADIRTACDSIAESLEKSLSGDGMHHLGLAMLRARDEGNPDIFRQKLSDAIRRTQEIGKDKYVPADNEDKEIRNVRQYMPFCNLYIWDSQTDSIPISGALKDDQVPDTRLNPPVELTERIFQIRLINFWRNNSPKVDSEYDIVLAEKRYEALCNEFLPTLPRAFVLEPNKQWDKDFPWLPYQREFLHISIFSSICYNYRPVLQLEPQKIQSLPANDRALLGPQRKALAVAAFNVLTRYLNLHTLESGISTRLPDIIMPTFDAAVLLAALYANRGMEWECKNYRHCMLRVNPFETHMESLKPELCMETLRSTLDHLQKCAETSVLAKTAAETLDRVLKRVNDGH